MFKCEAVIVADRTAVTLSFPLERAQATAEEMEELALAFAAIRSNMNPPVGNDPALGVMATALDDPRFFVGPETMRGGALLQLRHPGCGWLRFWIPHSEVVTLISLLQEHGLSSPTAPSDTATH